MLRVQERVAPTRRDRIPRARVALVLFGALEVIALPLMLWWGRSTWFFSDDWDFLASRTGGNVGDLMRAHFGHWTTLPILAYRLLWWLVGIRSYRPYQVLVILGHLTAAALLRAVIRRSGVRPWLATLTAGTFVFFGAGAENILVAFQITFVGSLVFGLAQLLLADHDGPIDRRDWLGLVAGFAGLLCSGVALTMTFVVGLATLSRRGWRVALFHTAPLAGAYLVWLWTAPKGEATASSRASSVLDVVKFVRAGAQATFDGFGQLSGLGIAIALLLIIGLALIFRQRDRDAPSTRLTTPLALLAGAAAFLVITGVLRSGPRTGSVHGAQSRYVYLVGAMVLPSVALAAETIVHFRRQLGAAVAVLLLMGVPGNITLLASYETTPSATVRHSKRTSHVVSLYGLPEPATGIQPGRGRLGISRTFALTERRSILIAPRLPFAAQLPPSLQIAPDPHTAPHLKFGWLLASLPSGRIPNPGPLTPNEIATQTLRLALMPWLSPSRAPCHALVRPTVRRIHKGELLTVKSGGVELTYVAPDGGRSQPRPLRSSTVVALAGPLRLHIIPQRNNAQPPVIC